MLLWKQIRSLARSPRHMLITNASAATLRLASFEELKINHDSKVGEAVLYWTQEAMCEVN